MNVFDKIKSQKTEEGTPVWMVGEQLADMIRRDPKAQEIVSGDLDIAEMNLKNCEKKIKEYADNHRSGNFACVTPAQAEKIIREFYGLTTPNQITTDAIEPLPERESPVKESVMNQPAGLLSLDSFF